MKRTILLLLALLAGCDRKPQVGTREWKATDHDGKEDPARTPAPKSSNQPKLSPADILWENQCASCHGLRGKGDGPNASTTRPPNLARVETQSKSDKDLASVIRSGRAMMPKFELDDSTIASLVQKVRSFRE